MATQKKGNATSKASAKKKPISTKKILANELKELLAPGLAKWKKAMGEEKFEKKIKKAAKILADGIPSTKEKKPAAKKSSVKKKKAKAV